MITQQSGQPNTIFSAPSDTSLTTVYTQLLPDGYAFLQSVNIAAVAGADATLIVNDGTTDYEILSAKTLSADDREFLEWQDGLPLREDYIIKVKSSVGDALVFTLVINEILRGPQ